jgi:hypothetical protein
MCISSGGGGLRYDPVDGRVVSDEGELLQMEESVQPG